MKAWQIGLLIGIILCLIISIVITLVLLKRKRIKNGEKEAVDKLNSSTTNIADSFGGKDNIESIQVRQSRVTVTVHNMEKVDKEKIVKEYESVMFMGVKIVFVVGAMSQDFKKLLEEKTKA